MNKQQRLLLILFVVIVVVLLGAIIGINLARRTPTQDTPTQLPTEMPTPEVTDPLAGLSEEEIAALAMQEEHGEDYVSTFDDDVDLPDITADPNATPEPID